MDVVTLTAAKVAALTTATRRYGGRPAGRVVNTRSNRLMNGRTTNTSGLGTTFKVRRRIPYACGHVTLWYANTYVSTHGENPNTNPLIVRSLLVKADGTVHQVTFNGGRPTLYLPGWSQTSSPSAPTLTAGTVGNLTGSATYYVVVTYVTEVGETAASSATSVTVGSSTPSITVTAPSPVANATGWRAYVNLANAGSSGPFYLAGSAGFGENLTLVNNVTAVLSQPPYANTTAGGPQSSASGTPTLIAPSDPVPADFTAGELIYEVCYVNTPASGQVFPVGTSIWGGTQSTGEGYATGDITPNHASIPTATNNLAYCSQFMTGVLLDPARPSIAIIGDSIPEGTGDPLLGPTDPGYVVRGLNDGYPYAWLAKGSEKITDFMNTSGGGAQRRLTRSIAMSHCNVGLGNYGTNDIGAGVSLATCKANLLSVWADMKRRGMRVYWSTMLPRTKSLDGWQTAGPGNGTTTGQYFYENSSWGAAGGSLHAQEDIRQALNQWLRAPYSAGSGNSALYDAAGALDGIVDTALTVEANSDGSAVSVDASTGALSGLGGGYWIASSGVVASGTATGGSTSTLVNSGASWTTDQYSGQMVIVTSGTGAGSVTQILSNTSTTLTFNAAVSVGPGNGSGYTIFGGATQDGIHPSRRGHVLMAVPVASWAGAL